MAKLKDIAVIIPMNDFSEENVKLFNEAVASVPSDIKVYVSYCISTDPSAKLDKRAKHIGSAQGDSFQELVNEAVGKIKEKWFSILEFDDSYTNIWFDEVLRYVEFMPEVSMFLPLEDITDFNNGKYIGYGNEAPLASSFSDELGFIDNPSLMNYFDFYPTGSVFNTDDWNEVGGLKPSMKITFWYEWMLRATHNGKKLYVIPKVGYNHTMGRKGSLVEQYKATVDEKETMWWFDNAKKEQFFREDRGKTYQKDDNSEEVE